MRLRRSHNPLGEEENPYWMSFSDIMSGLLVIFILASTALMLQLLEMKEELSAAQAWHQGGDKPEQHGDEHSQRAAGLQYRSV